MLRNKEEMDNKLNILVGPDEGSSMDIVSGKSFIVGRSPLCDIQINDLAISQCHLVIYEKDQKYYIADLGSKNGTFIYGKKVEPCIEIELLKGVPIVIGTTVIGLGEASKILLKPLFDLVGIYSEYSSKKSRRVNSIKRNLSFVYKINDILSESHDTDEIIERLLDSIYNLFIRIDRCVIIIIDDKNIFSKIKYKLRSNGDDPNKVFNRNIVEKTLFLNRPIMVSDSEDAARTGRDVTESLKSMSIQSAMCVPIASFWGTFGATYIDSCERTNSFRTTDLALLRDVSGRVADSMYMNMLHGFW